MYREVTMIEFREMLRLWREQVQGNGLPPGCAWIPMRRYVGAAEAVGLRAQVEVLFEAQSAPKPGDSQLLDSSLMLGT
jgi:hypothetical protein